MGKFDKDKDRELAARAKQPGEVLFDSSTGTAVVETRRHMRTRGKAKRARLNALPAAKLPKDAVRAEKKRQRYLKREKAVLAAVDLPVIERLDRSS